MLFQESDGIFHKGVDVGLGSEGFDGETEGEDAVGGAFVGDGGADSGVGITHYGERILSLS